MNESKCMACGSRQLEQGSIMSAAFAPDRASSWQKALAGAEVKAQLCMDCGHLELHADLDRVRSMLGEKA